MCWCVSILWMHVSSVQYLSHVRLFVTPWTAAHQTSLSITNSWSLLKLMSIKPMMPSSHLILCHPLLLLPSIFPSIRVFSFLFFFFLLKCRWGDQERRAERTGRPTSSFSPLLPPPPARPPPLATAQGLFKWVSSSHQVAKVLEFQL